MKLYLKLELKLLSWPSSTAGRRRASWAALAHWHLPNFRSSSSKSSSWFLSSLLIRSQRWLLEPLHVESFIDINKKELNFVFIKFIFRLFTSLPQLPIFFWRSSWFAVSLYRELPKESSFISLLTGQNLPKERYVTFDNYVWNCKGNDIKYGQK